MFQRMTIEVTTAAGVVVDHRLIAHEHPRGLLAILPGRGYTPDHPVLHYLRKAAADAGYDVLSVWYSFQIAPQADEQVTLERLAGEVDQALGAALRRGYRRLCIAGKSLGTPLAVMQTQLHPVERLILLTPIGTAVQDAGRLPTLAVMGTADSLYQPEAVKSSGSNVEWLVLDGLDHGLEAAGDWAASLDGLARITQACAEFLG